MIGVLVEPIMHEKIIKEMLSRIGIANTKENILYPSCYLTRIDNKYVIVHFKEVFPLLIDDGFSDLSEDDFSRRNTIVGLLESWNMIKVIDGNFKKSYKHLFILKKELRPEWTIYDKINVGSLNEYEENNND
jgi:hypothetical protein